MNPHSPSNQWLERIASGETGYSEAETGDKDSIELERDTGKYKITVEKIGDEEK